MDAVYSLRPECVGKDNNTVSDAYEKVYDELDEFKQEATCRLTTFKKKRQKVTLSQLLMICKAMNKINAGQDFAELSSIF